MNIQTNTYSKGIFRNSVIFLIGMFFFAITILLVPFLIDNQTIRTTLPIYASVMLFFPLVRAMNSDHLQMDPQICDFIDMIVTVAIWIVVSIVTFVLGIFFIPTMLLFPRTRFKLMYVGSAVILFCFGVSVKHFGKLPKSGPYIICPNHTSFVDYFLSTYVMGWNSKYTVVHGANLHNIPVIGLVMKKWLVPVDRSDSDTFFPMITQMRKSIDSGLNVLIYPEGGRIEEKERESGILMKAFKPRTFNIAFEKNISVVPVAIIGAYDIKPKSSKRWWLRPGKVEIHYCDVVNPEDKKPKEISDEVRKKIMAKLS